MNIKKKLRPIIFIGLLLVFAFTMIIPVEVHSYGEYPGMKVEGRYGDSCLCPWPWSWNCGCIMIEV